MKLTLVAYTKDCEKIIAVAAKQTLTQKFFSESWENISDEEVEKWIIETLTRNHTSPWEHCSYTFAVEEVSRVLSHQLVRHRLASYSQLSQRYKRLRQSETFVIPPKVTEKGEEVVGKYIEAIKRSFETYQQLIDSGVPPEDARYVLPQAFMTKLVVTMNARELLNFFGLRMCHRAQWEIRALAWEMFYTVKKVHPKLWKYVGPRCLQLENTIRKNPIPIDEVFSSQGSMFFVSEKCPEGVTREHISDCIQKAFKEVQDVFNILG